MGKAASKITRGNSVSRGSFPACATLGGVARADDRRVLVLASTSPQRRAILAQMGIPFRVVPPPYEEDDGLMAEPVAMVRAHAEGKARSVLAAASGDPVLAVDTTVFLDGRTWSKPSTAEEAAAMLRTLSGRTHEVISGLCLVTQEWQELHHDTTRVRFRRLQEREIEAYVRSGEWRGRAGGYAIQGRACAFVQAIEGDFWNVVGLPAPLLAEVLLRRLPDLYPPEGR